MNNFKLQLHRFVCIRKARQILLILISAKSKQWYGCKILQNWYQLLQKNTQQSFFEVGVTNSHMDFSVE
jgi:hypothetical protein